MTSTLPDAAASRKAPATADHASPLPAYAENLATALARHVTRLNAEIDAITADAQRDITALSGALHSAVTALRHMTLERDRLVEAYHRQIEANRSLRARLLSQESVAA